MKRFQIIQSEYVYVKLKPNNSLKNNNSHLIARTIASMYKGFWQSRNVEEEKLFRLWKSKKIRSIPTKLSFKRPGKVGYFIYMEKEKIEFYFIIPQPFYSVIKEKINGVWSGITVEVVDKIPTFSEAALKYAMVYEKEDGLSLTTNRTDNDLLNASLNVVELLEEGDKAGILYNFIPMSQNGFKFSYKSTINKVKDNLPTERKKTGFPYLFKMMLSIIDTIINDLSEALAGKRVTQDEGMFAALIERLNGGNKITESTVKKIKGQLVETQILVLSESKSHINERSNATALAQSFDVLSGDNRLIKEKYNKIIDYTKTRYPGMKTNKMWDEEVQSMISVPGRELLEKFSFMDQVKTTETLLPLELQTGTKCIGTTTYRGHSQKAYLTEDEQYKKLLLCLIGPTRAGKTNFLSHLSMDAIENDECVFMLDFVDTCQASESVRKNFSKDQTLVIRFNDPNKLEGLGYNEANQFTGTPFEKYKDCKSQMTNTIALINSINDSNTANDSRLSPRMGRFLEAACLIVYASGGAIKEVIEVMTEHNTRFNYISKTPKELDVYLNKYVEILRELDQYDSKTGELVGTKTNLIIGVLDRLSILNRNTYMELMLQQGVENNVDLVEEFQKNQLIVVEIPEAMFSTQEERDVMVTYWATKIWYALQLRSVKYKGNLKQLNLVIDEIYQVPNCEIFLTKKISQAAKFGFKPIISCHYIKQLKYMRDELRSVNPSYMLIAGCDKENFKELNTELKPFTEEDLQNLDRYQSMNYIKTKNGYAKFITQLPGDVKHRKPKKVDEIVEDS